MRHRIAIVLVVITVCAAAGHAQAKTDLPGEDAKLYSCRKAKGPVAVRFKPEVELKELLSWAMGFTCKNFVYSSRIASRKATVTIIAPKKMTAQQAYRVFLVALQSMTLTVVPKGSVLEIIEAPQAKKHAVPLYRFTQPANRDQIVRMVLRPKHIPVADVARALAALRSLHGDITAMPGTGVVLVTDYGSHISKMVRLMRDLDRPLVKERLYLIKVRNISVKEMAETLEQIFGKSDTTRQPVRRSRNRRRRGNNKTEPTSTNKAATAAVPSKIITVERTSSLILLATKPAYLRAKAIVDRVDVAVGSNASHSIHVYYVRNGTAKKIVKTLTAVIQGAKPDTRSAGARRSRRRQSATATAPSLEGDVRLTHDETTNALVVAASLRDYHALLQVIKKLDQPRRQVFIEAVILEVKLGNTRTVGVSYHGGSNLDSGSVVFGGVQHKDLKSVATKESLGSATGLIAGLTGKPLAGAEELLGISLPSFGVLFQALATVSNIEVLSTPHVTTVNNVEAVISVGERIPTKTAFTGTASSTTAAFAATQSVKYEDIDLELKVTPHVNASGVISMDVELNIAELSQEDLGGLGPAWVKRQIKNTVVVTDQESIVIGGLMKEKSTVTESKVPLLGDIPVLGALFRTKHTTKEKSNLLVILTPYVMKDVFDRRRITARKMRERREFVRTMANFKQRTYLPNIDYRRKRGLIEEINRAVQRSEREAKMLGELNKTSDDVKEGRID